MTFKPIPSRLAAKIEAVQAHKGLGRIPAADPKDKAFPMRVAVPEPVENIDRFWPMTAPVLDQGNTPHCVGFAWTHFLLAAPTTHRAGGLGMSPTEFAHDLYRRAQDVDEWPGNDYDGTSGRAGAKVLQADGRIGFYRWAETAIEARSFVITIGPALIGIPWMERMFVPDADGYLWPDGNEVGGHELVIIGNSVKREAARLLNSWSRSWGQKGRAWMKWDVLQTLLNAGGDCCSTTEVKPPTEL